jgi:hypothetical protein
LNILNNFQYFELTYFFQMVTQKNWDFTMLIVATLTLGLQANQGHGKCASQGMQPMSHIHTPMSTKK